MMNEDTLKEAFNRFRNQYFEKEPDLYQQLTTQGQSPNVLLVTCSDSRIVPDHLFSTKPGDLFVVRSVANLIHPFDDKQQCTQAALEYAVCHLKVGHIIVMGHSQCGGIKALLQAEEGLSAGNCIDAWIKSAQPVAKKIKENHSTLNLDEQCHHAELASIQHSLTLLERLSIYS